MSLLVISQIDYLRKLSLQGLYQWKKSPRAPKALIALKRAGPLGYLANSAQSVISCDWATKVKLVSKSRYLFFI
jgi:hypothetical protein